MIIVDPETVARYEKFAAAHPALYRLRVAITAVLGDFFLIFLTLLPLALMLALPLLFYRHPWFDWAAGLTLVFFLWVMRPSFRVEGRELTRAEAPALFAELDALRQKLDVPGSLRVCIDDKLNASAAEGRGFFGLFGTTRVLTLGLPLLATLSRAQVLAVVAHEFGHFSRRHGRLGHWLYRAHMGWLMEAESSGENRDAYDRAMAWYGKAFAPHFSSLSFVYSRQCEYEADADAASAVGATDFAAALVRINMQGAFWGREMDRQIAQWCRQQTAPPADFYQRASNAAIAWETANRDKSLADALAEAATYADTHPSLSQRLAALNAEASADASAAGSGAALLGDCWKKLREEFNTAWCKENRFGWHMRHCHFQYVARKWLPIEGVDAGVPTAEQQAWRCRSLLAWLPDEGLAEIRRVHTLLPEDDEIAFLLAAHTMANEAKAAVALMETIWQRSPVSRIRIGAMLRAYFWRAGETSLVETWDAKLTASRNTRRAARQKFRAQLNAGEVADAKLDAESTQFLHAAISAEPCIAGVWIFSGEQILIASREAPGNAEGSAKGSSRRNRASFHAVHLLLDTAALKEADIDEEQMAEQFCGALEKVLPLFDEILVNTVLNTEALPALLSGKAAFYQRAEK